MRKYLPITAIFVIVTILLLAFKNPLLAAGYDAYFMLIANAVLFVITYLGFRIVAFRASASNVHAFMRGVFTSFLLKMFVIVTALFIFITLYKDVNKPAILISMGLYIIYSAVEVFQLMKMVRNQKNE